MTEQPTTAADENEVLLRRLDRWAVGDSDTGPLIRWAAAHLRGCVRQQDASALREAARDVVLQEGRYPPTKNTRELAETFKSLVVVPKAALRRLESALAALPPSAPPERAEAIWRVVQEPEDRSWTITDDLRPGFVVADKILEHAVDELMTVMGLWDETNDARLEQAND